MTKDSIPSISSNSSNKFMPAQKISAEKLYSPLQAGNITYSVKLLHKFFIKSVFLVFLFLIMTIPCPRGAESQEKKNTEPPVKKSGKVITGMGGGYFTALGDIGDILKPNYSIKLFAYNNNISGTPLGVGIDAGYADLHDTDNSGGIKYIPVIGYVTLTIPIKNILDIQFKTGLGITTLLAKIDNGISTSRKTSTDFSCSAGGGIMRTIYRHYVIGIDGQFYYLFEKKSSTAAATYFYAGYKF